MAPGVIPGVAPPLRRDAPAAQRGGSLPSFPSPLTRIGSDGLGRKTRTATGKHGRGDVAPPPLFLWHPPLCRCHMSLDPGFDPSFDPGRVQTTGHNRAPHVTASGLMSRRVLHVE